MATSLYVHIPFCSRICSYCDFSKVLFNEKWAFSYIEKLIEEIDSYKIKKHSQKTIYVGGGTPSTLPDALFDKILGYLSQYLVNGGEFTIEANPESLTEEKIKILKKNKVNRVSLGVESSNKSYLELMDRPHTFGDVVNVVSNLKKGGITNINVDLIYALPGETNEEVKNDIEALLSLDVPHLSTYSLILEDSTKFKNMGLKEADDYVQADQYELILGMLRGRGYERYEVSNYSRPGFESQHNQVYWRNEEYYGCGMGASGYLNGVRYKNTGSILAYLSGKTVAEEEIVEDKDKTLLFLMTNLRLKDGFDVNKFKEFVGVSFDEKCGKKAEKLISSGLLVRDGNRIHVSDKGMLLLDKVVVELI